MLYKILKYTVNWVCHTFSEHNLCYLTYIFIIIILAPLSLGQYLDYIENVSVKSFVSVPIDMVLLLFTFHCTVQEDTTFLWQKVSCRQRVLSSSLLHCVRTLSARHGYDVHRDCCTARMVSCCPPKHPIALTLLQKRHKQRGQGDNDLLILLCDMKHNFEV